MSKDYINWYLDGTSDGYDWTGADGAIIGEPITLTIVDSTKVKASFDGYSYTHDYNVDVESASYSIDDTTGSLSVYAISKKGGDSMSRTSAVGTWVLNETISIAEIYRSKNINFSSNGKQYVRLDFDNYDDDWWLTYQINTSTGESDTAASGTSSYKLSFNDDSYRTITITGGTDATNDELISWLEANATFVITESLPKLAAPTNVTLEGTTLTFDEVEGATSYEIYADNVLIGTYVPVEPLSVVPAKLQMELTNGGTQGLMRGETATAKISGGVPPYTAKFDKISSKYYTYSNNDTKVAYSSGSSYYITLSVSGDVLSVTSYDNEHNSLLSGDWSITIYDSLGNLTSAVVWIQYITCLTGDTLITMYDGTQKRIDQIQRGEYVLSIDSEGNEVPGYVYYSDSDMNKTHNHYDRFVFSDGTEVKVIHRHRFYNMEEQAMVHLDQWYIGDHALKQNGDIVELTEIHLRDYEGDPINHYTIFCDHNTYFANGILCGNRFSDELKLGEPAAVDADGNEIPPETAYYPILCCLPSTFEGYSDAWIDDETKDFMLVKDGRQTNYYQIGYDDSYGVLYQMPEGAERTTDANTILNEWTKVAAITHEHIEGNIEGLKFDAMLFYVRRTVRTGGASSASASDGEQVSVINEGEGDCCVWSERLFLRQTVSADPGK